MLLLKTCRPLIPVQHNAYTVCRAVNIRLITNISGTSFIEGGEKRVTVVVLTRTSMGLLPDINLDSSLAHK